ncbi:MAG: response regulator [Thiobacillus sp.]|nr:response regulator [Thiobacillus sp.]
MPLALSTILYVEDEPDIRTVARLALETVGGFTLRVCGSGEEAVEAGPAFKPDLLLLDVMMPGMDGPTTLAALRENPALKETPVIFMTAKVQPSEIQRYRDLGALDVIAKPFDPMTLADQVRNIWKRVNA